MQELLGRRKSMDLYRAAQQSLKRFVQFKIYSLDGIAEQSGQLVQEFQEYIGPVLGLEHMHLQPIFGYGVIDDRHVYIAGRFMSGSLNGLLKVGALPLNRALDLALQTLMALTYIHSQGFIHSSLSPHNIYLDESGSAYIDDLELSLIVQKASSLRELQSLLDEPYYMSVEQLRFGSADFRSEIYSFGAVLYHMLTGSPPFSDGDKTFEAVLERKLQNQIILPHQLNPAISPDMEAVILRSLRANPNQRFANTSSLADELEQLVHAIAPTPTALSLLQKLKNLTSR
ncbi:MAG: serine/threonine-protein kinase [Chloroflexota bacterium]